MIAHAIVKWQGCNMTKQSDCLYKVILSILSLFYAISCGGKAPGEIEQGANVIGSMLKPANLSRSMFAAGFPDGKPSQFVSYFFSDMGVAEWPPTEGSTEFTKEEMTAMKRAGQAIMPAGVAFVPLKPAADKGKQIVVKFDNAGGVVITEGYIDPSQKPVLVKEWKLPGVSPAPGVMMMYQSNMQSGMSNQAF